MSTILLSCEHGGHEVRLRYRHAFVGTARLHPFRERFAASVDAAIQRGPVLHPSVHSFTPVLDGRERAVDVGLLYDPARGGELALGRAWARSLAEALPAVRVRRNAPYRGISDGHVTALRRRHPEAMYRGVEIEVSQRLLPHRAAAIAAAIAITLTDEVATDP